jgi:protocatechuate 3,4-dioxygenase beta subunit
MTRLAPFLYAYFDFPTALSSRSSGMRSHALASFLFLLLQSAQVPGTPQQTPKASIEGIVVRIGTADAIPGARLTLTRVQAPVTALPAVPPLPPGPPPVGAGVISVTQSAPTASAAPALPPQLPAIPAVNTDSKGMFVFKDIEPGSYRIQVASNGYARTEYGQRIFGAQGTPINLTSGQVLKDLAIPLTPAGNISGQIRDLLGQPLAGIPVQLLKPSYNTNGQRSLQSAGSVRTNDHGEYRLYWVTPGRYYLNAGSSQGSLPNIGGGGASPNEVQDSYVSTYYPGVTDLGQAAVLEVRPADELSGVDLKISRQQLYKIRGRVIDSRISQPPQTVSMTFASQTLTGGGFIMNGGPNQNYTAATGAFEFRDIAPGTYVIGATVPDPAAPNSSPLTSQQPRAQASVTVSGSDIENVVLAIVPSVSLPGRFSIDGPALSTLTGLDRIRVQLRPSVDGMLSTNCLVSQTQAQAVNADGIFKVDNVSPGEYRVSVTALPPGYYVKEARLDQTDVLDQPMRFSGTVSGPLDVVVSANGGLIEGTIVNDKQKPVPGTQAVLIPARGINRIDLYKTAVSDDNGRFTIRGITPGDYKIYAWEALEQFAWFDSDLLRQFEQKGKFMQITEGAKESAEVKIIPLEGQ